jgi:alpha-L-fucosidase
LGTGCAPSRLQGRGKPIRLALFACLCWAGASGVLRAGETVAPPPPLEPVPSPAQLAWHEDELTMFVHFGMNTFTGRSTGLGDEDPKLFNPTNLDCRQWARVAKECGFKGIILTAKHHDGFCLWPTATTEHSVRSSSWKDGKGDVVRELADACGEEGIKLGIYCSPWDRSTPLYTNDPPAYAAMYHQQLTELLSNYGPVYEMWFDGNKANVADWPNIVSLVRRLQPNAVIKQGPRVIPIREDLRWVGNPGAIAPLTNWCVYPPPGSPESDQPIWFPVECDIPMVGSWFWNERPPMELNRLLDIYYKSVGRNSILLLNVAPDKRGRFSDESVQRLREFRAALDTIFGKDVAAHKYVNASNVRGGARTFAGERALDGNPDTYWATDGGVTNAGLEVDLEVPQTINVVDLQEAIDLGQRVQAYKVEGLVDNQWKLLSEGTTIGHRKLDRFPKVTVWKVRLMILQSRACPAIRKFGLYLDTVSPPESFEPDNALAGYQRPPRTR